MGVGKFSGSSGGRPMSDNDIFQGKVQTPEDTMLLIFCIEYWNIELQ